MIDPKDKLTADLLGPKRGRPATGKAMTAAERKRKQRQRARMQIFKPGGSFDEIATTDLCAELSAAVTGGKISTFDAIAKELKRRNRENSKP